MFFGNDSEAFEAVDAKTGTSRWHFNTGQSMHASPMTYSVNGKQYVAILTGLSPITKRRHSHTPELREQREQTMLFVFGL